MVARFLRGGLSAADAVAQLLRYEWAGWCGTGSELLYGPQSKTLLIAYLQLGRVDLALAACGDLEPRRFGAEEETGRWDRRLLAAAGIDWERFYVGGVLSGQSDMADLVARHGSDRAAHLLLASARALDAATAEESNGDSEGLLWPLAALVESRGACMGQEAWDSRDVRRDAEAEPIHDDVQEGVLDFIAERVGAGAGLSEAEAASHLLTQLCRPESREAFRAMLESRYDDVRKMGAIGLRALGETIADPEPSRPVAFRVVVDGQPAAGRKLTWALVSGDGGQESSSAESDDEGIVRLARDAFVDPRRPVTSVRLAAPDLDSAAGVWFEAGLDPPADLDGVKTLSVRTGSLTVIIPRSLLSRTARRPPTLQLLAETGRYGLSGLSLPVSRDLPVASSRIVFPHLQHGRYEVRLRVGDGIHASPVVEVGERPATAIVSERTASEELILED